MLPDEGSQLGCAVFSAYGLGKFPGKCVGGRGEREGGREGGEGGHRKKACWDYLGTHTATHTHTHISTESQDESGERPGPNDQAPGCWWMAKTRRGHLRIVGAGEPLIFGWDRERLGTFRHGLPLFGQTQQLCDRLFVCHGATKATERGLLSLLAPSFTMGCAIQSLARVAACMSVSEYCAQQIIALILKGVRVPVCD